MTHTIPIRIYFEDTDAGGVTYHGSYLNFGERGRTEYLRHIGHTNSEIKEKRDLIFVVAHLDISYNAPSFLDDLLEMRTSVIKTNNTSFVMHHSLIRNNEAGNNQEICKMDVTLVCVNAKTYKPVRLPEDIKQEFSACEKE